MKLGTMKWLGNNIELNDMQGVHTFLLSFSVLPDARLRSLPRNFKSCIGDNGGSGQNKFR